MLETLRDFFQIHEVVVQLVTASSYYHDAQGLALPPEHRQSVGPLTNLTATMCDLGAGFRRQSITLDLVKVIS